MSSLAKLLLIVQIFFSEKKFIQQANENFSARVMRKNNKNFTSEFSFLHTVNGNEKKNESFWAKKSKNSS